MTHQDNIMGKDIFASFIPFMLHHQGHVLSSLTASLDTLFVLLDKIETTKNEPQIARQKKRIIELIESLRRFYSDLSSFSRPRSVEMSNLSKCLKESIYSLGVKTKSPKIEINIQKEVESILVPKNEFRIIIMNLMENALEAIQPNGSVSIQAKTTKRKLILTFSDDGIGLPPELLQNGVQPFYTTKPHKTGLGLTMVNMIVKQCGGILELSVPTTKGATFNLQFPIKEGKILIEKDSMDR